MALEILPDGCGLSIPCKNCIAASAIVRIIGWESKSCISLIPSILDSNESSNY
jgi:hypothetical protein